MGVASGAAGMLAIASVDEAAAVIVVAIMVDAPCVERPNVSSSSSVGCVGLGLGT